MAFRFRAPKRLRKELGEAQALLLEVVVDPPSDPWHEQALRQARRAIIFVIGCTILLIGVAMVILPGPAVLVIPFALVILATEFVWAKRLLARIKGATGFRKRK
jgi:cobalamin synthase